VLPPLMLYWYSSAAPVGPPDPAAPVTIPVLNPAQMVLPLAGEATPSVGATGVDPTVHVLIVLHAVLEQP
ncbi:MAG: hypothetical protein NTZ29_17705, partial [Verrucomicrobia bacterium]|nr:hypothetical protein [Verrucomicrobiota bacterium]